MKEEWRQVPGLASRYEVSNRGGMRTQSYTDQRGRRRSARVLAALNTRVDMADGTMKVVPMAQRVLLAFVGPRPEGCRLSRHLNDVHTDNRVENLAWGTDKDNHNDAVRNGCIVPPSLEGRAKIAAANRRRKFSTEARARLRAAHLGHKHTPETRAKMSAALQGRKFSPEHCAKLSAAKRGKKLSPETCAKISAAKRKLDAEKRKETNAARKRQEQG